VLGGDYPGNAPKKRRPTLTVEALEQEAGAMELVETNGDGFCGGPSRDPARACAAGGLESGRAAASLARRGAFGDYDALGNGRLP
jgi:hypothetical protein